jgi:hypothetical protein
MSDLYDNKKKFLSIINIYIYNIYSYTNRSKVTWRHNIFHFFIYIIEFDLLDGYGFR